MNDDLLGNEYSLLDKKILERVRVISLKDSPRRKDFIHNFQEKGFSNINFFDAVDGKTFNLPGKYKSFSGTYGCRASLAVMFMESIVEGDEWVLVFEDDAIPNVTKEFLSKALEYKIPQAVNYINLCRQRFKPKKNPQNYSQEIVGTFAILVKKPLMLEYIDYVLRNPLSPDLQCHSDRLLLHLSEKNKWSIHHKNYFEHTDQYPSTVKWGFPNKKKNPA